MLYEVITPDGATIDYTDYYSKQVEDILNTIPEKAYLLNITGMTVVTESLSVLNLKPWEERERSQQEIVRTIAGPMFGVPGVLAFPLNPPSLGQSFTSQPIAFVIKTRITSYNVCYTKLLRFTPL